ncbi:MAG: hypothetical protein J5622_01340 [Firmicutes bacterium]|nr:hypothetical protein [Bacillota bacterium]
MSFLYDLSKKYKTVSIVGMSKNAGKTTALNYFLEEAMDEGMILGITSTGRDGESTDLVTNTEKPRVFLETDTIVSVPRELYDLAEAGLEILRMTKYPTALGDLMLCRVADSGYVQIAGPLTTQAHKEMCKDMFDLGAELVLIDGAIDRKSIAAPETSDAIILSTGATISRSMKKVAEETAHIVNLYRLPILGDEKLREELRDCDAGISLVKKGEVHPLDLKTGLSAGRYIDSAIDEDTEYIYVPGALTDSVLADISPAKLKKIPLVLKDPTKIFISSINWGRLCKRGLMPCVLDNIKVAAVTVNPYAPQGYVFDHRALLETVQEAIPDVPVIDVRL